MCHTIVVDQMKGEKNMKQNEIQRLVESNYKSMSDQTKEKLFGVSNAVFTDKKF